MKTGWERKLGICDCDVRPWGTLSRNYHHYLDGLVSRDFSELEIGWTAWRNFFLRVFHHAYVSCTDSKCYAMPVQCFAQNVRPCVIAHILVS